MQLTNGVIKVASGNLGPLPLISERTIAQYFYIFTRQTTLINLVTRRASIRTKHQASRAAWPSDPRNRGDLEGAAPRNYGALLPGTAGSYIKATAHFPEQH